MQGSHSQVRCQRLQRTSAVVTSPRGNSGSWLCPPVENHSRNDFPGDRKSYVPRLTPPRKSLETLNLIAQEDSGMGGSFKSILKP